MNELRSTDLSSHILPSAAVDVVAERIPIVSADGGIGYAAIALAVFLVILQVYMQRAPAVSRSAAAGEFSSARAMEYLSRMPPRPHPIGSHGHAEVRDFILSELTTMGAHPEVEATSVVGSRGDGSFVSGSVENILVRLKQGDNNKAILLAGHYDSVASAPGANDDGSAVAVLLETIRALGASPPLKNDLIFLFSDGEETGLLGARAFVNEHRWAKDVEVALNFEARGDSGQAIMFEPSDENTWLIREFATADPHPVATSLNYEVYRHLANNTDFSVFRESGLAGLNFAYIEGLSHYHTRLDDLSSVDERSLQHQGNNAYSLALGFGNLDLNNRKKGNSVYFDILGRFLVNYPASWVVPLSVLASLMFIATVLIGFMTRRATLAGMIAGFLGFVLCLVITAGSVTLVWATIYRLNSSYSSEPWNDPYNGTFYRGAFIALAISVASVIYIWLNKRDRAEDLRLGVLLGWEVCVVLTAIYLPAPSFLVTWPLIVILIPTAFQLGLKERRRFSVGFNLVIFACLIPAVLLFPGVISFLFETIDISASGVVIIPVVLLLALFLTHIDLIGSRHKRALAWVSACVSAVLIVAGAVTAGFDSGHPRVDNLIYCLNADSNKAIWASTDRRPDEWTAQFFPTAPEKVRLPEFLPTSPRTFLSASAPLAPLPGPSLVLANDTTKDGTRSLVLQLASARLAPILSIYIDASARVTRASINGKPLNLAGVKPDPGKPLVCDYYGVPSSGISLDLDISPGPPFSIKVVDASYGLPKMSNFVVKPRPDYIMANPSPVNDSSLVARSYSF
jgi:hypothetical protein